MTKEGGRLSGPTIVGLASIPIVGAMLNGLYNGPLYRFTPAFFWIADITLFVLAPAVILYWLARTERILPRNYGLAFPFGGVLETVAGSVFFAAILAAAYGVSKYIGWIFMWRWYVPPDFTYGAVTPDGFSGLLVAGYWAVTAGLVESVFYIGLPWCLWRNRFGLERRRTLFLWLSAALFALTHWEQGLHGVIAAFVFGLAACVLYWKINDLWPIVGAHALVDLALFLNY